MLKWKNIKLGWKFGLALVLSISLFLISTAIVWLLLTGVESDILALQRRGDRAIKITQMGSLVRTKDIRIADYINSKDEEYITAYQDKREQFNQLEADIRPEMDTEELQELFNQIVENDKKVNDLFINDIVPAVKDGDQALYSRLRDDAISIRKETVDLLQALRAVVEEERQHAIQVANANMAYAIGVLITAVVISTIVGSLITYFVSRMVNKNLSTVINNSRQIADGNLVIEKIDYKGKDEIGQLAGTVNTMHDNLTDMIERIQTVTEQVSASSQELSASGDQVGKTAEQVGMAIQQVASGAEEQSAQIEETGRNINDLIDQIEDVENQSDKMNKQAEDVMTNISRGNNALSTSVEKVNNVREDTAQVAEIVNNLGDLSGEIGDIVELINGISTQTNLLALNAAIEAARAGEAGRGFNVVAEEIRELAEESSQATENIANLIKEVRNGVDNAVKKMNNTTEVVEESVGAIEETGDSFVDIKKAADNLTELIDIITKNAQDMSKNSVTVEQAVNNIASVSQEAAGNAEEVAASSEEQVAATEEIVSSAGQLAKMAEDLSAAVNKFDV